VTKSDSNNNICALRAAQQLRKGRKLVAIVNAVMSMQGFGSAKALPNGLGTGNTTFHGTWLYSCNAARDQSPCDHSLEDRVSK
jgi:hypothetical protein